MGRIGRASGIVSQAARSTFEWSISALSWAEAAVIACPARIELHDFAAQPTAQVNLVNSRFLTDVIDEVMPARVRQAENEEEVKSGGWTHTFPHGSVAVIALRRQ